MPHEKGQKRQRVASRVSTRCLCNFNVLSLWFQRVVSVVSTCWRKWGLNFFSVCHLIVENLWWNGACVFRIMIMCNCFVGIDFPCCWKTRICVENWGWKRVELPLFFMNFYIWNAHIAENQHVRRSFPKSSIKNPIENQSFPKQKSFLLTIRHITFFNMQKVFQKENRIDIFYTFVALFVNSQKH